MSRHSSFQIAELLSARLCHDLITPIGAVNTGLELFQETPPDHVWESREILGLVVQSAQTASARVSFFRAAFGSGGGPLSLGEARNLIEQHFIHNKLQILWKSSFQKEFNQETWGRLLLNTILWMNDCAPRGGTLEILTPQENLPLLSFRLKANPLIFQQGSLKVLNGESVVQDLTPRTIVCYLIHSLVEEGKNKLSFHHTPSLSEMTLEVKPE